MFQANGDVRILEASPAEIIISAALTLKSRASNLKLISHEGGLLSVTLTAASQLSHRNTVAPRVEG